MARRENSLSRDLMLERWVKSSPRFWVCWKTFGVSGVWVPRATSLLDPGLVLKFEGDARAWAPKKGGPIVERICIVVTW
jgi:hypothetical protein